MVNPRRLDFASSGNHNYTRVQETARLRDLLEKSVHGSTSTVLIESESGVGKSTLLNSFLVDVVRQHPSEPLLGFGKFEERSAASEPFSAIVDLVGGVLEDVSQKGLSSEYHSTIAHALDSELSILIDIIPRLASLGQKKATAPTRTYTSKSSQVSDCSVDFEAFGDLSKQEWRFERFRFAFRELIRCISKSRPLVLVLDDLQFADRDSMQLLSTILDDNTDDRMLLFIGASRPIDESDVSLRTLLFPNARIRPHMEVLQLEGLSEREITSFLEDLFGVTNSPKVQVLADIVRTKSEGNAFVIVQFLRHLEQTGHIYFSENNQTWEWDCTLIRPQVDSPETVESTIVESINKLDESQRLLLITAASFGVSHFDISVIVHALQAVDDGEDGKEQYSHHFVVRQEMSSVGHMLDLSIRNGFVQELSPGHFKFSHDRTREAAYSLLPEGRARQLLHLEVGRRLRRWMDTEEEFGTSMSSDSLLLHAAKQLNAGSDLISDDWEKLDVAELNLNAAEIAAKKSSFFTSMEYLQSGIAILGNNGWESHYGLMLKLRVALTRIQYSCGLFSECMVSADDVIANGKTFDDKKAVYNQKLFCLVQQERSMEGIKMAMSILRALGHPVPKRFLTLHVLREYLKTSSYLNGLTDDDIRNLPEFHDSTIEDIVGILTRIGELCWSGAPEIYLNFTAISLLALLKERGNHPVLTPISLQVWGWLQFSEGGSMRGCRRFTKLSMEMMDRLCDSHPSVQRRMVLWDCYYSSIWCEPMHDLIEPIAVSLRETFQAGELDIYYMDAWSLLRQKFVCGTPLLDLDSDCRKFLEVLRDYRQDFHWRTSAPITQAVSCLMGMSDDPSVLVGEIIDPDELQRLKASKISHILNQCNLFCMVLAYHFGKYEESMACAANMNKDIFAEGTEFLVATRVFYTGLAGVALFRQTRRRKYRRTTVHSLKLMKQWIKNGASNCLYMKLLLEAEVAGARDKLVVDTVYKLYTKAIDEVSRVGLVHHEALANELVCAFLQRRNSLERMARTHLHRSVWLYGEWQATAIVHHLQSRYSDSSLQSKS